MKLRALLLSGVLALAPLAAQASNLTPDQLTQATSLNSTDLMVIYPSGGPMKSVQWGVVQSLMQTFLGGQYLQISNNLSDIVSAPAARSNLGLGNASVQNIGTSGATLCLLNTACTFSALETFSAGVSISGGFTVSGGSITLPSNSLAYSYLPYTAVNKAGDTMTGGLTTPGTSVSGPAGTNRAFHLQTSGVDRWQLLESGDAETGGNAGSNFDLCNMTDGGGFVGACALQINRATGAVSLPGALSVTGGITSSLTGNAATATKLATARTITLSGSVSATCPAFDGSANITCSTGGGPQVAEFNEQESPGSNSSLGSIGSATWTVEPLNSTVFNNITGASISGNQITLPTGIYQIHGYAVARAGTGAMMVARLRNITTGGANQGQAVTMGPSTLNTLAPFEETVFIGTPCVFDIDVWVGSGVSAAGGFAINTGANEVYTDIQIEKVS